METTNQMHIINSRGDGRDSDNDPCPRLSPSLQYPKGELANQKPCLLSWFLYLIDRTFLVRFGSISGEFGRAMVRILARRSRAKIPMATPNEPDMPPKRTKKGAI